MGKEISEIIKSAFSVLNKDARDMISVFVAVFTPMLMVFGFFFIFMWGMKTLDSFDEPKDKCWSVQELKGKIYSVNQCTGETKIISGNTKLKKEKINKEQPKKEKKGTSEKS